MKYMDLALVAVIGISTISVFGIKECGKSSLAHELAQENEHRIELETKAAKQAAHHNDQCHNSTTVVKAPENGNSPTIVCDIGSTMSWVGWTVSYITVLCTCD